ncbi:chymotrypsin-like serine proteinase [Haliotis asinina]|uniref:chymotrypsin-like serine proteinase n=1 Tax=Haliotis asinina TaxID=109174 RepID=UPI003531A24C
MALVNRICKHPILLLLGIYEYPITLLHTIKNFLKYSETEVFGVKKYIQTIYTDDIQNSRTARMSTLYIVVLMCLSAACQAAPQKRFSGGTNVTADDFPWVGSLQQNISGTWTHICGMVAGTNVGTTAAQCYPVSDYRLVFDAYDLSDTSQATITTISTVLRDSRFTTNGPGFAYDNIELRTSSAVTAYALPTIGLAVDHAGLQCDIFGWGKLADGTFGTILQTRNVTLISRADCQARVSSLGANITSFDTCVDGDVISEGDAGNPLRCNGDIVGVASWSTGNSCTDSPVSVFTASINFFVG